MNPERKLQTYVVTATVFVMYALITNVLPMISGLSWIPSGLLAIASTVGTYHLLSTGLDYLSRRNSKVMKHILGPSYLHGTWRGSFSVKDHGSVTTVEHFEQTLSELKIRGWAFLKDGSTYSQWRSTAVSINAPDGSLTFAYDCDSYYSDSPSFNGIALFQFDRTGVHRAPTDLYGYTADLDGKPDDRFENRMKKVSESLVKFEEVLVDGDENA